MTNIGIVHRRSRQGFNYSNYSQSFQLFLEIHDLINMRERLDWSKTWQGKYFNFLGYFFSLYCTWKIFISTVNIVFDRVGRVDPITKGMEIAGK